MTAYDVPCPTCRARVGEGCMTRPWGDPARAPHIARRRAASGAPGTDQRPSHPPDEVCPACGRRPGWRSDGSYRRHRIDANNPVAPMCAASPKEYGR